MKVLSSILGVVALMMMPGDRLISQINPSAVLHQRFDFGEGPAEKGWIQVTTDVAYSPERGYGFVGQAEMYARDSGAGDPLTRDNCFSREPFYFSVTVPEGNYRVNVTLGDSGDSSSTAIKAESRRLMCHEIPLGPGQYSTRVVNVNVRNKYLGPDAEVRLTHREAQHLNWDNQLTLEFNGARPAVCAVEIISAADLKTIYLAGNSTVTDQKSEPWASWGQMLPVFFRPDSIVIANHAESGESLVRFLSEHRLEKILTTIRPGDYLFIQFGHNDQKPESKAFVEAFGRYQDYLRMYIGAVREKGAVPVLVTPVHRRTFDRDGTIVNSHGDYPDAVRQVAASEGVPLLDLHLMSGNLFEAMGPDDARQAFVHVAAGTYPGQDLAIADDSHFSNYGAMELAKCIVHAIRAVLPDVAMQLRKDIRMFEPTQPDLPGSVRIPESPPYIWPDE